MCTTVPTALKKGTKYIQETMCHSLVKILSFDSVFGRLTLIVF